MCGIIGYVGYEKTDVAEILLGSLERLEYRGYDSAGIAVPGPEEIIIRRRSGTLIKLQESVALEPLPIASIGIGHTRWATHGRPNEPNAHPHSDCDRLLAL